MLSISATTAASEPMSISAFVGVWPTRSTRLKNGRVNTSAAALAAMNTAICMLNDAPSHAGTIVTRAPIANHTEKSPAVEASTTPAAIATISQNMTGFEVISDASHSINQFLPCAAEEEPRDKHITTAPPLRLIFMRYFNSGAVLTFKRNPL